MTRMKTSWKREGQGSGVIRSEILDTDSYLPVNALMDRMQMTVFILVDNTEDILVW